MTKLFLVKWAMLLICFSCVLFSCNSEDTTDESKLLENTTWHSVEFNSHTNVPIYKDRVEENSYAKARIPLLGGLKYTVDEIKESDNLSSNICIKNNHQEDGVMSLSFTSGKCKIQYSTFQSVMKAKRTIAKSIYRFQEGTFTVSTAPHTYESITIYSYGIYRADGTCFIPFDGDGYVAIQTTTTYTDKKTENINLNEKTILADYKISKNKITFSCTENSQVRSFAGTLSDDGQSITLYENPFVPTILTFKR
ncbi:MAG: hypothetical protein MJZ32_11905 [Bacteroidaceae bacterium]|nr:hypothetical protein [Bacteroidaceae bacterium]